MAQNPTPQQVLNVMKDPAGLPFLLVNDAWAAIDVAHALPRGTTWMQAQPVLEEMERCGWIARVRIKGTRVPRYRVLGG